ncbi:large ribosomal subunit protein mL53 [Cherax quadricarinatus]|nr:39S ribosomal protein L53, mitochondrial-like [Cherax quadricarinatus]
MALPYIHVGAFTRSAGLYSALGKQSQLLNLKPVKKITFTFDPLSENGVVVRNLLNYFYLERVRETNLNCVLKTKIVSTRADPTVEVDLVDGKTLLYQAKHLQPLEVLHSFNALVSSQVKAEAASEDLPKGKLAKFQMKR